MNELKINASLSLEQELELRMLQIGFSHMTEEQLKETLLGAYTNWMIEENTKRALVDRLMAAGIDRIEIIIDK